MLPNIVLVRGTHLWAFITGHVLLANHQKKHLDSTVMVKSFSTFSVYICVVFMNLLHCIILNNKSGIA